ncbi:MAG: hypothetical protein AAF790_01975 [Planctomycetota bacterium]
MMTNPARPRLLLPLLLAGIALSISGCVKKAALDGASVYTMQWWVPTVGIAAAAAVTTLGWYKRKSSWRWMIALIGAPIAGVAVVPGLFLDKVVVDDSHFALNTGFWFMPTEHDVAFADLSRIDYTMTESRGRRGRKKKRYYFECYSKSGSMERVPLGELMNEASGEILSKAEAAGVAFNNRVPAE